MSKSAKFIDLTKPGSYGFKHMILLRATGCRDRLIQFGQCPEGCWLNRYTAKIERFCQRNADALKGCAIYNPDNTRTPIWEPER